MGRWAPNPQDRLMHSAVVLFTERGYDKTTVLDIARHAGLAKSSFFRLFRDKREVLFGREQQLTELLVSAIEQAPGDAEEAAVVLAAISSLDDFYSEDRREFAFAVRKLVADNAELRERELLKRVSLADNVARAMQARGADDAVARLASDIAVMAIATASAAWSEPQNSTPFTTLAEVSLRRLLDTARTLSVSTPQS